MRLCSVDFALSMCDNSGETDMVFPHANVSPSDDLSILLNQIMRLKISSGISIDDREYFVALRRVRDFSYIHISDSTCKFFLDYTIHPVFYDKL